MAQLSTVGGDGGRRMLPFLDYFEYNKDNFSMPKPKDTSWGNVAGWYHEMLESEGTFQKEVILPNLKRLLEIKKGETVLDLACGTGFFSREFATLGAKVIGVDLGKGLIEIAKHAEAERSLKILRSAQDDKKNTVQYVVSSADDLNFVLKNSVDTIVIVLALQNIENVHGVLKECKRVLKPKGKIVLVLNHPAFRVPKSSDWGWDEESMIQYRRIDAYLSEKQVKIEMHPGENKNIKTISFHRPLQYYFKMFAKNNLAVTKMEEWISNRVGPKGRKFAASEKARKEIPLFLFLELKSIT